MGDCYESFCGGCDICDEFDEPSWCSYCDGDHTEDMCDQCAFPAKCTAVFGHLRSECATAEMMAEYMGNDD